MPHTCRSQGSRVPTLTVPPSLYFGDPRILKLSPLNLPLSPGTHLPQVVGGNTGPQPPTNPSPRSKGCPMQNPTPGGPLLLGTPPQPHTTEGPLCSWYPPQPHTRGSPLPAHPQPHTVEGLLLPSAPSLLRVSPAPGRPPPQPHTPGYPRPPPRPAPLLPVSPGQRPGRTTARQVRGGGGGGRSSSEPLSLPPPARPRKKEVAALRPPCPRAGGEMEHPFRELPYRPPRGGPVARRWAGRGAQLWLLPPSLHRALVSSALPPPPWLVRARLGGEQPLPPACGAKRPKPFLPAPPLP